MAKRYTAEEKAALVARATELRAVGMAFSNVAKQLTLSVATVYNWLDPDAMARDRLRTREYHRRRYADPLLRPQLKAVNRKRSREYTSRPAVKAARMAYRKSRLASDPQFRLARSLRSRLYSAVKGKAKRGSAVRDLGCTIAELKAHLESLFTGEMGWANYGTVWQIDHRLPLASFDLTDRDQLLVACHWTNLQPLTVEDNLRKGAKVMEVSC